MSLHDDLLAQAKALADLDPGRPKQANLRRAVSSAYYALFHLLIDESVRFLLTAQPQRRAMRQQLARCFEHGHMKQTAQEFSKPTSSDPWRAVLSARPTAPLANVAATFADLQAERHRADYDLGHRLSRGHVQALITRAQVAFTDWQTVSSTEEGEVFRLALLARSRR